MSNRNWSNAGHFYAPQVKPVLLNCSFIVDSANGNGLGIRSLKGPNVANVFMHTSATPVGGNPNPAAGIIVVQLADNYNRYLGGFDGFVSPTTGSPIVLSSGSGITAGVPYIIASLGTTTTAANWVTAGLRVGYTAAVGATFIATAAAATGTGLGNATVIAVGVSGVTKLEVMGDPNQTIAGNSAAGPTGAQIIVQCLGATSSSVTTLIPTAPANGSVCGMSFYLSDSQVTVAGQ